MTNRNRKLARNSARIIRCLRKQRGWNQIGLAADLGMSQSKLSKLETAAMLPSADEWLRVCELGGISPYSLRTGRFGGKSPITILKWGTVEPGFRIPERYAYSRGSGGHAMIIPVLALETKVGERRAHEILREEGFDPDFFVNLDHQVNCDFTAALGYRLAKSGVALTDIVKHSQAFGRSEPLAKEARNRANFIAAAQRFVKGILKVEINHDYALVDLRADRVAFSVSPRKHLGELKYGRSRELMTYACSYTLEFFRNYFHERFGNAGLVTKAECRHASGGERCLYVVQHVDL